MPKRTDLKKIMVIGSGPIVIGQACEFDYSGTQGIKALKEEGYEVVLVNSNPATIMTDPGLADRTYIEPIEPETVAAIVRKERPCAILPTLGGQTGLNTALALAKSGVLAECGTELIGARAEVIEKAESRELFRQAMENIGLKVPQSAIAHNMDDVRRIGSSMPFPMIIRPAFTLGGTGGGIAYNMEQNELSSTNETIKFSVTLARQRVVGVADPYRVGAHNAIMPITPRTRHEHFLHFLKFSAVHCRVRRLDAPLPPTAAQNASRNKTN